MMNAQQQICPFCGAEKIFNPKTGKWFCKEKCWLKKKEPGVHQETPTPSQRSQSYPDNEDINWEKVEENNNKKSDSMSELNAKRIAGEYANILLELRMITPDQWDAIFQDKANEIYNIKCVPFAIK